MDPQTIHDLIERQSGSVARELFQALFSRPLPNQINAIVCLQGDQFDRLPKAAELSKHFQASILLIGNNDFTGPGKREGEGNDFLLREWVPVFTKAGVPENMIMIDDQAFNTKEQAARACELAKHRGWKSLVVVASPYHLLRAFLTFVRAAKRQNFSGRIFASAPNLPWDQPPAGKNKTARELLSVELAKIERYKDDVATYEEGLASFI